MQTALDHGAADAATTLRPWEDPVANQSRDAQPPALGEADPFSGLAEPHEIVAAMSWIKDTVAFSKARTERLSQGGGQRLPREGAEDCGDKPRPDWKALREARKANAAAAKLAAAKPNSAP